MTESGTLATWTVVLGCVPTGAGRTAAIEVGQVDDFEDGTVLGWVEGLFSPSPPGNVPDGGPMGAADAFQLG